MKVALYARVSSQRQEKRGTIASQVEALRHYAREHHYSIAENYVCKDEGYSGAVLARPELDRLRDGAQAGAFDAILVLSPESAILKVCFPVRAEREQAARPASRIRNLCRWQLAMIPSPAGSESPRPAGLGGSRETALRPRERRG